MSATTPATRILVVEDEFLIRLTLVEALADEGFDVLEAETGDMALPILQRDGSIALLLTDIQMPGRLNGRRLAAAARETRPNLPVLFMTGQPDPVAEAVRSPLDRYISKPYRLVDICDAVRSMIGLVS